MADLAETLSTPPRLTIAEIGGFATLLRSALGAARSLTLATDQLAEADLTFVQLLVAAQRSAAAENRRLAVTAPEGGTLAHLLARCGIGRDAASGALVLDDARLATDFAPEG